MSLDRFLHLLFPHVCVVCGRLLVSGEDGCCSSCMAGVNPFENSLESEQMLRNVIASRFGKAVLFERGWCRYQFHKKSSLQLALHAMKYEGLYNLGNMFGFQLGEWMLSSGGIGDIECIVPVPLHRLKKIERSYNQSEKIADGIGKSLARPVMRNVWIGVFQVSVPTPAICAKNASIQTCNVWVPAERLLASVIDVCPFVNCVYCNAPPSTAYTITG